MRGIAGLAARAFMAADGINAGVFDVVICVYAGRKRVTVGDGIAGVADGNMGLGDIGRLNDRGSAGKVHNHFARQPVSHHGAADGVSDGVVDGGSFGG